MDLITALRIALRRWKIAAVVLIIAVIAAAAAYLSTGAVYSASNYVVVVPSTVTTNPSEPSDPAQLQADQVQRAALVSAGGARLVSNLLVTNLNSAVARQQFGDGQSATYSVGNDAQLPVVTIGATGSDEAAVKALLGRVVDGADGVLGGLQTQAGIPVSSAYRAPRFAPDPIVSVSYPDRTKVVVALLVAGLALALLLAVALDGPLNRREQARASKASDDDGEVSSGHRHAQNGDSTAGDVRRGADPPQEPIGTHPGRPYPQPGSSFGSPQSPDGVNSTDRLPGRSRTNYPGQ